MKIGILGVEINSTNKGVSALGYSIVNLINKISPLGTEIFIFTSESPIHITQLDENTFLYEEELIIGYRMKKTHFQTIILSQVHVIHLEGQTTKNVSAFAYTEFVKSEIYYCIEYLQTRGFKLYLLFYIRCISFLLRSLKYKTYRKYLRTFMSQTRNSLKKWGQRK